MAVVDVDDAVVPRPGQDVGLHVLHDAGEHHREQRRIGEDAGGALQHPVGRPVGADLVLHGALEDVVVGQQPVQELPSRLRLGHVAFSALQAGTQLADGAQHIREVLDAGEDRLQDREDLVLEVA